MSKPRKEFQEYINVTEKPIVTLELYRESPATAFLHAAVEAKCAEEQCLNHFKINKSRKKYSIAANNAIQIINASLLAYVMSNFETYQKFFFAQLFEYSIYLKKFDVDAFVKRLVKETNSININLVGFAAYRENPHSVGLVLAENLNSWHNPETVNRYYDAFNLTDEHGRKMAFYSNEEIKDLFVLWQMRHSIVHNAGTITLPDSQKRSCLNEYGGKSIILEEKFIYEVVRKMHRLVKEATERIRSVYIHNLSDSISDATKQKVEKLFKVSSTCNAWLR